LVVVFPAACWYGGADEKYSELILPLYLLWLGIICPYLDTPTEETDVRQREYESYKFTALKYEDSDLAGKIEHELQLIHDWRTPVTVGALKSVLGKYDGYRSISSYEIDQRLAELKAGKS